MLLLFIGGVYLVCGCALRFPNIKQRISYLTGSELPILTFVSFCLIIFGIGAIMTFFILD